MKKFLGLGLSALLLLAANPVSAQSNNVGTSNIQVVESDDTDGPIITPFEAQLIPPISYTGIAAYEKSFTMDPGNGKDANVWLYNKSSAPIYMKIYKNGVEQTEVTYESGQQKTVSIYSAVRNDYKIYIFSKTGHKLDIDLSARQF